jgi:hypothetical protein
MMHRPASISTWLRLRFPTDEDDWILSSGIDNRYVSDTRSLWMEVSFFEGLIWFHIPVESPTNLSRTFKSVPTDMLLNNHDISLSAIFGGTPYFGRASAQLSWIHGRLPRHRGTGNQIFRSSASGDANPRQVHILCLQTVQGRHSPVIQRFGIQFGLTRGRIYSGQFGVPVIQWRPSISLVRIHTDAAPTPLVASITGQYQYISS